MWTEISRVFVRLTALLGTMATCCALLTGAEQARAQRATEDWVLIGTQEVDRTKGRETIDLRASKGRVKAVRLIAKRNGVELSKVGVTYAGGRTHNEARRIDLNPNDRTRAIDEGREERFIDEVELVLVPAPGRSAAGAGRTMTMEIWGLTTAAGARAERPALAPVARAPAPEAGPVNPAPAADQPPPTVPPPRAAVAVPMAPPSVQAAEIVPAQPPVPVLPAPPVAAHAPSLPVTAPPSPTPVPAPIAASTPPPPSGPPAVELGPPGTAPPLPPSRGPNGRVAAVQQKPVASPGAGISGAAGLPVPPVAPSAGSVGGPGLGVGPGSVVGDETHDGIFLGRRTLGPNADRESIPVGLDFGRFDKIRLRALDGGVRLAQMRVHYHSGPTDEMLVDADVSANSRTRWLPITGDRSLREIEVSYRRRDVGRNAATIEIYGEHADGYLDPGGEGARVPRTNGWVPLGARTAALRVGFDQLELQIGRNKGGFKKLRVDAKDRAITLREVRVVYGTGEDEIITIDSTHQRVAAGASFGPIDLRGGTRQVKSIVLKTRSKLLDSEARGKDAAIVEVWAQH